MTGINRKKIAVALLISMLFSAVPTGIICASEIEESSIESYSRGAETEDGAIESYSKGTEYDYSEEKGAVEQLEDLFTTIDLQSATITDLQREMEKGNLTSEKLTRMYLDRINAYDKKENLNSIIWINDNALSDARRLDSERAGGRVRGKLHGIPIIVKDNYNVAGMPTSAGAVALADLVVDEDAGVVKKLKEAGAVIIAKANMSEFAMSAEDSHSTLGGDAHNAYDPSRSPAGSSGGSATAAASNFAAAALGTDTGGSIRNPSSWSGLFGIRPSKGLTSIDGVLPLQATRDTTGPMARSAEDMAIVLEAMAGTDENDDYTVEASADGLRGSGYTKDLSPDSLKGKRIAFLTSSFDYHMPSCNKVNEYYREMYHTNKDVYNESEFADDEKLPAETEILARQARAVLRKAGAEFVSLSEEKLFSDEFLLLIKDGAWNIPYNSNNKYVAEYDINLFLSKFGEKSGIKTFKDILNSGDDIGCFFASFGEDQKKYGYDLADHFEKDEYEKYGYYADKSTGFLRPQEWEEVRKYQKKLSDIMKEKDIDAVMYMYFTDLPMHQNQYDSSHNSSSYDRAFGPSLGLPDMNIPMGFRAASSDDAGTLLPMGLSMVGRFGGEKELMEIAYAYEKAAGDSIKHAPGNTPALRDEELNSYLDALMEEACRLNPVKMGLDGNSSVFKKLNDAYDKALNADYDNPYSVYNASYELAQAYDKITYRFLEKRKAAGTVLLKGQKINNIPELMFKGIEGISGFNTDDKKTASVSKKGVLKGKKEGKTRVNALASGDRKNAATLSSCTLTVINRPKLVFKDIKPDENSGKINGYDAFVSDDTLLLEPDSWKSSKNSVAEVDENGMITVKGKGKTKITAVFGNIKVKGTLKIQ